MRCGQLLRATGFAWSTISSRTLGQDRKSTRLNSSHLVISYAVFCLKKKKHSTVAMHATFCQGMLPCRSFNASCWLRLASEIFSMPRLKIQRLRLLGSYASRVTTDL